MIRHAILDRLLRRTFAALCGAVLVCGQAALAQSIAPVAENPPGVDKALPAPEQMRIEPVFRTGNECGAQRGNDIPSAMADSCPFSAQLRGFNLAPRFDLPGGEIALKLGFARGSDAALSLDRQMRRVTPARQRENTLTALGAQAILLDGQLQLSSDLGWSQSWERNLTDSLYLPAKFAEESGFSQRHRVEFKAIDRPGLRWQFDGTVSRTDEDFRIDNIDRVGSLLMGQGDSDRLATRLDAGKFRLQASRVDTRTIVSDRSLNKASIGYNGVAVGYSTNTGSTRPQALFQIARTESRNRTMSFDFDLYSLMPMIAMDDSGWASIVPKQFTVSFDRHEVQRPSSLLRADTRRKGVDLFGMWSTPLGDTVIDYAWDSTVSVTGEPVERSTQLLVTHSFDIDDWRFNLDLLQQKTSTPANDNDDTLYYSASVSRKFADGARLSLEFGRDILGLGGRDSDFSLRDGSHLAKLKLDLSEPLQKKFDNPSVRFAISAQVMLNRSEYELRFLNEVIDSNSDGYARQGVLASFGYSF